MLRKRMLRSGNEIKELQWIVQGKLGKIGMNYQKPVKTLIDQNPWKTGPETIDSPL
jgi:hypothetical protein